VVDEPALRAEAGLDTQPSAAAIAGTRRNMLDKVLEADRYPAALITVSGGLVGVGPQLFHLTITLHGTTVTVEALAQVEKGPDEVTVTGTAAVDQSRFGITPFAVLGGALACRTGWGSDSDTCPARRLTAAETAPDSARQWPRAPKPQCGKGFAQLSSSAEQLRFRFQHAAHAACATSSHRRNATMHVEDIP